MYAKIRHHILHSALVAALCLGVPLPVHADTYHPPKGFPDLSQFKSVNIEKYRVYYEGKGETAIIRFSLPSGIGCVFTTWSSPLEGQESLTCSGRNLSITSESIVESTTFANDPCREEVVTAYGTTGKYAFRRWPAADCYSFPRNTKTEISPGYKISDPVGITCTVTGRDAVACIGKLDHGFVISPKGSWTF